MLDRASSSLDWFVVREGTKVYRQVRGEIKGRRRGARENASLRRTGRGRIRPKTAPLSRGGHSDVLINKGSSSPPSSLSPSSSSSSGASDHISSSGSNRPLSPRHFARFVELSALMRQQQQQNGQGGCVVAPVNEEMRCEMLDLEGRILRQRRRLFPGSSDSPTTNKRTRGRNAAFIGRNNPGGHRGTVTAAAVHGVATTEAEKRKRLVVAASAAAETEAATAMQPLKAMRPATAPAAAECELGEGGKKEGAAAESGKEDEPRGNLMAESGTTTTTTTTTDMANTTDGSVPSSPLALAAADHNNNGRPETHSPTTIDTLIHDAVIKRQTVITPMPMVGLGRKRTTSAGSSKETGSEHKKASADAGAAAAKLRPGSATKTLVSKKGRPPSTASGRSQASLTKKLAANASAAAKMKQAHGGGQRCSGGSEVESKPPAQARPQASPARPTTAPASSVESSKLSSPPRRHDANRRSRQRVVRSVRSAMSAARATVRMQRRPSSAAIAGTSSDVNWRDLMDRVNKCRVCWYQQDFCKGCRSRVETFYLRNRHSKQFSDVEGRTRDLYDAMLIKVGIRDLRSLAREELQASQQRVKDKDIEDVARTLSDRVNNIMVDRDSLIAIKKVVDYTSKQDSRSKEYLRSHSRRFLEREATFERKCRIYVDDEIDLECVMHSFSESQQHASETSIWNREGATHAHASLAKLQRRVSLLAGGGAGNPALY